MEDNRKIDGEGEEERPTVELPSKEGSGDILSSGREGDSSDIAQRQAADEGKNKKWYGRERRKHQRVKVKLHMIYDDGKSAVKTNVLNISLGGAFLEMKKPLKKGAEIKLMPVLPKKMKGQEEIKLKGRVVRVVEYDLSDVRDKIGVGVEFTDITGKEREVLASIFKRSVDGSKVDSEGVKRGNESVSASDSEKEEGGSEATEV